jgi:hypothetical protein
MSVQCGVVFFAAFVFYMGLRRHATPGGNTAQTVHKAGLWLHSLTDFGDGRQVFD